MGGSFGGCMMMMIIGRVNSSRILSTLLCFNLLSLTLVAGQRFSFPTHHPTDTLSSGRSFSPTHVPTVTPTWHPTTTPAPSITPFPSVGPTRTGEPSVTPVPSSIRPSLTPSVQPTVDAPLIDSAGSARAAAIQAICVVVAIVVIAGLMQYLNYTIDKKRADRKREKIANYEIHREVARQKLRGDGIPASETESKILELYPERDWDEEELDEIANEPSQLMLIFLLVWSLLLPIRLCFFRIFCYVRKTKLIRAVDKEDTEMDDGEEEDDTMIEGFPIDCGTNNRKFLSISKAMAVTVGRHPHKQIDENDEIYIQPYGLCDFTGQHNMSEWPLKDLKKSYGCIARDGFIEKYGIGMSLYFKFLKTVTIAFFIASCFAIFPIFYFWTGSGWDAEAKATYIEQGGMPYVFFYTTAGSLRGQSYVCGSAFEGERLNLECENGVIQSIEAYYGTPEGSCTCPPEQSIVPSTGECPGDISFKDVSYGECRDSTNAPQYLRKGHDVKPCFKGEMWNGDECCAYGVGDNKSPDLDDLAMIPHYGCNSASAMFIAQAACLGNTNCTIDVNFNNTFEWEETENGPCAEGLLTHRGSSTACSVKLNSPSSNFSLCPADMKERRFVVRGICDSQVFTFDGEKKEQDRAQYALACSWLDALGTLIVFGIVIWMADREEAAVWEADVQYCSADDFTLRILHVPRPTKGVSPDLSKLKARIKQHFDEVLETLPPVVHERHCQVIDVNLGMNNQDELKNMKIRGTLARILDLQKDKLDLMNLAGVNVHNPKTLKKEDEKYRLLKIKFLESCERVKFRKTRLEARTAFVTFDSEEAFERIKKIYIDDASSWRRCCFGMPIFMQLDGIFPLKIVEAERPSDYIWENLATPYLTRVIKVLISNISALTFLLIGFAIIIKAKDVEAKAKLKLGETDCTVYEFDYSGKVEWEERLLNVTGTILTRQDVVENEYPDYFNNTLPNTGLLGCFCLYALAEYPDQAANVEFMNPHTNEVELLCDDWIDKFTTIQIMSSLAICTVIVVNEALKGFFRTLVDFEGHETHTQEILSLALKLFVAMLVNTALLVVLIAGNLNLFTNGRESFFTQTLDDAAIFSGPRSDFTWKWYLEVGSAIVVTMFINVFALNASSFSAAVQTKLFRCIDRSCTLDMTRTQQKFQIGLENLYTGPKMMLEERYAALLVQFTVSVIYSGGMPILWIVGFLGFLVGFIVDKWAFLRVYRLPPKYGPALARKCTGLLPYVILGHALLAVWAYTTPEIFDYKKKVVFHGNESALNYGEPHNGTRESPHAHTYDFWPADTYTDGFTLVAELERATLHANAAPHVAFVIIWALWYGATKVLNLDDILTWCLRICARKEKDFADANDELERGTKELQEKREIEALQEASGVELSRLPEKKPSLTEVDAAKAVSLAGGETEGGMPSPPIFDDSSEECWGVLEDGYGTDDGLQSRLYDNHGGAPPLPVQDEVPSKTRAPRSRSRSPNNNRKISNSKIKSGESKIATKDSSKKSLKVGKANQAKAAPKVLGSSNGGAPLAAVDDESSDKGGEKSESKPGNTAVAEIAESSKTSADCTNISENGMVTKDGDHELNFGKLSKQKTLSSDEVEEHENHHNRESEFKGGTNHQSRRAKALAKRLAAQDKKNEKKRLARSSTMRAAKQSFGEDGEQPSTPGTPHSTRASLVMASGKKVTEEDMQEHHDFRENWLNICDFVQEHRGRRKVEGNADFLWSISTEELKKQVYAKYLGFDVRKLFEQELKFRKAYPATAARVKRVLQGLSSYDFRANEEYTEAFAMDSKSLRSYERGKMQVSGEDYELLHKGWANYLKRCIFGAGDHLDVVYPNINDDLSTFAERHTSAVGINPTAVVGPRFILNIRIPPAPPDLNEQEGHGAQRMGDKDYDEWKENWQYIRISITGVFDYRMRLPKGLQFKKIPEIQIEIPAIEMTKSPFKTAMIGGKRRSLGEVTEFAGARKGEQESSSKANVGNLAAKTFKIEALAGAHRSQDAEHLDHKQRFGGDGMKKKAKDLSPDEAASKIQRIWHGKAARLAVSRMKSWQSRYLFWLESFSMTIVALIIVAIDLFFTFALEKQFPKETKGIAYTSTVYFTFELSLRFYCYAYLARSDGCDLGDLDFFTSDYTRMVDLVAVLIDITSLVIILMAGTGGGVSFLRSSKGARVVRVARLLRIFRALRVARMVKLANNDERYKLTGDEPIGMQRYHIRAPEDVEKGNRLEVTIAHFGKLYIQWPLYAQEDQPIQFHLPVVCKHHYQNEKGGKLAPNCCLVKPSDSDLSTGGKDYQTKMGQQGWVQLFSPLDDHGLGKLPPHRSPLDRILGRDPLRKPKKLRNGKKKNSFFMAAFAGNDEKEDALAKDVDDTDSDDSESDASDIEEDDDADEKRMKKKYRPFYDNFRHHRVWYQVMAFAPKPIVKDFTKLEEFVHELEPFHSDSAILTLPPGNLVGERIECVIHTQRGVLHNQRQVAHIPGVGDLNVTILASNEVTVNGLHGHPLRALGVLPWGNNPAANRVLVPDVISEIYFDFPGLLLPRAKEIISMRAKKKDWKDGARPTGKTLSAGKYLKRDLYTQNFQVLPLEVAFALREAQRRKKEADEACCKPSIKDGGKGIVKDKNGPHSPETTASDNNTDGQQTKKSNGCTRASGHVKEKQVGESKKDGGEDNAEENTAVAESDNLTSDEKNEATINNESKEEKKIKRNGKCCSTGTNMQVKTGKKTGNKESDADSAVASPSENEGEMDEETSALAAAAGAMTQGGAPSSQVTDDAESPPSRRIKKNLSIMSPEEAAAAAEQRRATALEEGQKEADKNMGMIKNLDQIEHKSRQAQKIIIDRVGRFDCLWPENCVKPFNIAFPAIKPAKNLESDVETLVAIPGENANVTPMARRYQFGWVLLEMPSSPEFRIFLRLPAYVTHRMRALAQLPLNDLASPWSNRIRTKENAPSIATSTPSTLGTTSSSDHPRADKLLAKIEELEAKIKLLEEDREEGKEGVNPLVVARRNKNKGTSV